MPAQEELATSREMSRLDLEQHQHGVEEDVAHCYEDVGDDPDVLPLLAPRLRGRPEEGVYSVLS